MSAARHNQAEAAPTEPTGSSEVHVSHLVSGHVMASPVDPVRPGLGIVFLTSVGLLAVALPLTWISAISIAAAFSAVFGLVVGYIERAPAHAIRPEAVTSHELREAYRALLAVLADLDRTVEEAPELRVTVAPALARCRAAVAISGRAAQRASSNRRQYSVLARLELTRAALESFTAKLVELRDANVVLAERDTAAPEARPLPGASGSAKTQEADVQASESGEGQVEHGPEDHGGWKRCDPCECNLPDDVPHDVAAGGANTDDAARRHVGGRQGELVNRAEDDQHRRCRIGDDACAWLDLADLRRHCLGYAPGQQNATC